MKQAFVTGGSGFVGRNLISELVKSGVIVKALVRSEDSKKIVKELGAEPVHGHLLDISSLQNGCQGCDTVFHLAAKVEFDGKREEFLQINVQGTENVLKSAQSNGVQAFVLCSTVAVLSGSGPIRNGVESAPYSKHPIGPYGFSKQAGEKMVLASSGDGFKTVAIRPGMIWGSGDTVMAPKLAEAAATGRLKWVGPDHRISTSHVRNVTEGLIQAALKGKGGSAYYVTDGDSISFKEMVSRLLETQGVDPGIVGKLPLWMGRLLTKLGVISPAILNFLSEDLTVSDQKARDQIGYQGLVSREEGFQELKKNPSSK